MQKKVCLFVDGENFRHSIGDLFQPTQFNISDYLPKKADWSGFFNFIASQKGDLLRTYWYVVEHIDYRPGDNQTPIQKHNKEEIQKRFTGWNNIQNGICSKHNFIEFRRAGSIRYDLDSKQFGSEKAVDVKLAIDLYVLKDIYNIAIIVSGDQDYTPAIMAIKDSGKIVYHACFKTKNNKFLPGASRRLNHITDGQIIIDYKDAEKMLLI